MKKLIIQKCNTFEKMKINIYYKKENAPKVIDKKL